MTLKLHQDTDRTGGSGSPKAAPEPPESIEVVAWNAAGCIELVVHRHKFDIEPVCVLVPFHLLDVMYHARLGVAVAGMSGQAVASGPVPICKMQLGTP